MASKKTGTKTQTKRTTKKTVKLARNVQAIAKVEPETSQVTEVPQVRPEPLLELKFHSPLVTRFIFIRQRPSRYCSPKDKGQPVGCMAYRVLEVDNGYEIHFGLSALNPKDHFDRKLGRNMAQARMYTNTPGLAGRFVSTATTPSRALSDLFRTLETTKSTPKRIRQQMDRMSNRFWQPNE